MRPGVEPPAGVTRADLLLVLVAVMWGANFSIIKVAMVDVPPLWFAAFRFVIALVVMFSLARMLGHSLYIERKGWWQVAGLGLLGNSTYQLLFVVGAERTTAANAALILATVPVFVGLIGRLIGSERIALWGWIGIGLSLAGIFEIITGSDRDAALEFGGATLVGDLLILLATLAWSTYSVLARPVVRRYPTMAVTVFSIAVGTVPLVLAALPTIDIDRLARISARGWIATCVSAIVGIAIPYFIWNYGISRLGSARTSLYAYITPLVALIVAALWLGERVTPQQVAGGALVLAGMLLARRFVKAV